jgi:hypothetical protein
MQAATADHQLPVDFPGVSLQVCRPTPAHGRPEPQPLQLGKLGVSCASLALMPQHGKHPMSCADIETVPVHGFVQMGFPIVGPSPATSLPLL